MSYNDSLDDLGDAIDAIIDRAINSKDFQNLDETIRKAVNSAVDTGSEAVRRAAHTATRKSAARRKVVDAREDEPLYVPGSKRPEQPNVNIYSSTLGSTRAGRAQRDKRLPVLYQNPAGKLVGGILKTVGGGIMTLTGVSGLLGSGLTAALVNGLGGAMSVLGVFSAALLGGGVWLLTSGIRSVMRVGRFEKYLKALGSKTQCELNQLARMVGKSPKFVRKELKGMIDDGMFLEGHLDEEETSLITSDDSYVHYLEVKQKQAVQRQQEVVETKKQQDDAEEQKRDARVQEVLDRGNAFIRDIRACNDAIPGQEISDKISRMETLVRKIFDRVEEHPEVVPELKKLMDYYLPMTVKLLKAYADMDAQPVQGENIQNSKREIEATLDTLNTAFEKLLDSIFKTTALDVSSDISVLNTLLAQEGLTDDELTRLRKEREL
jgi:5-bromo-4-chloroindolyl phosphate hydrolysis protein/Arc/MetJ-type ribon-helix-helix transcriptional regulator